MRWMLFWTLFPFVLPQAIKVRRNAPRVSGAGEPTSGRVGSGKTTRLVAIGDSIIAGVGVETVAEALPGQVAVELARLLGCEVSWSAFGLIGTTSSGVNRCLVPTLPNEPFDVMVVSVGVNERRGEIGIRRAVGARQRDILVQFLMEAVSVATIGGISGIILGLIGLKALSGFMKLPTAIMWEPVVLALASAIIVGLIAGIQPAKRAANLNPIDALR
jgi:hypothetical protein